MTTETPGFREKIQTLRRRWRLIAIIVVAITALTYHHYQGQVPVYTTGTQVYVPAGGQSLGVASDPETDPSRRLANAATLLRTPAVARQVAHTLHFRGDPSVLLGLVSVSPSSASDFLEISATAADPILAARVANGFADAFVTVTSARTRALVISEEANIQHQLANIPDTLVNAGVRSGLQEQLQGLRLTADSGGMTTVGTAPIPGPTQTTSPIQAAIFAALLALMLASGVALVLETYNRRLRHQMVETEYGLPLLASIPFKRGTGAMTRPGSRPPAVLMERVRGLRTMVEHGGEVGPSPRTLLLTSAIPGEGKSTLAQGLGLAYFESGKSVLLIDADMRRPMLHEFFDAPLAPGLSDVLRGTVTMSAAVQEIETLDLEPALSSVLTSVDLIGTDGERIERGVAESSGPGLYDRDGTPRLHVLAAGSATTDPAALLSSERLPALLADAAAAYDLVVIDSPPILSVSDAIPVAAAVDAVIVVAREEFTTRDAAQRCRQALGRVASASILGVVANAVRKDEDYGSSRYELAPTQ